MAVTLNHTIITARDKNESATFLSEMLGLPAPRQLGHFAVVQVGETSLDFATAGEGDEIHQRHFAFLVSESEFDEIFARITERGLEYWADPFRRQPRQMNHWDDGRGLYFDDPSGHLLEILTRPYGSAGTAAADPHPLVSPVIDSTEEEEP